MLVTRCRSGGGLVLTHKESGDVVRLVFRYSARGDTRQLDVSIEDAPKLAFKIDKARDEKAGRV